MNAAKTVVRGEPRYNNSLRAAIDYWTNEVEAAVVEAKAAVDVEMTKEMKFGRKMGLPF